LSLSTKSSLLYRLSVIGEVVLFSIGTESGTESASSSSVWISVSFVSVSKSETIGDLWWTYKFSVENFSSEENSSMKLSWGVINSSSSSSSS